MRRRRRSREEEKVSYSPFREKASSRVLHSPNTAKKRLTSNKHPVYALHRIDLEKKTHIGCE